MNEELGNYNLNFSTNSDGNAASPEDKKTLVVIDASVFGIATTDGIKDIFSNVEIATTASVGISAETDDSKICEILKEKVTNASCRLIFVTKNDRKSDDQFWSLPSENVAVIRFTSGGTTTDSYILSLFALTKTRTYKNLKDYFGKDIRLGLQNVYHLFNGTHSKPRDLKFPHPHSKDYKRFTD